MSCCKSSHDSCRPQKSQMNIPFKKRKFFDCSSSVSNSDGGINSEGISDSTGKVAKTDSSGLFFRPMPSLHLE